MPVILKMSSLKKEALACQLQPVTKSKRELGTETTSSFYYVAV